MKLEVYPELLNPFILNDCIADCIAIFCKQPSLLGGHGGASLYLKVKELSLRDEGAVRSPQVLKNQTASLQARSTVLCYPPA